MPWAKVDDTFYDHPKVEATSSRALATYLLALSWCNRFLTDGLVPASCLRKLRGTKAVADELVTHGLWERAGDDYRVHDFLKYSRSKADVTADREATRLRQEEWRKRHRNGVTNEVVTGAPSRPIPSRNESRTTKELERVGSVLQRLVPRPS